MWSQDVGGKTLEAATKEDVMAALLQTEALVAHAEDYGVSLSDKDMEKVNQACGDFFAQESGKLAEATGATEELVKRIYEKNALANKVWQAVVADTDTQVSQEESQQAGIRYILIREETEGEPAETASAQNEESGESEESNEAAESPETRANAIVSRIQAGEDIGAVAEELGLTCNTAHYAKFRDESAVETEDVLGSAAASMTEGEARAVSGEGATGWYVVYCDTENDEEATENEVERIIRERKAARFTEVYEGWEKPELKVDEDVWELVEFSGNPVYTAEPETVESTAAGETAESTATAETVGETGAETAPAESEAQTPKTTTGETEAAQ